MALTAKEKEQLFQLRLRVKIDPRMTACRVAVEHGPGKQARVSGFTHFRQTDAFVRTVATEIFGEDNLTFDLKVLERGKPKFAVVTAPTGALWTNPDSSDPEQLGTEALYGTVVRAYHKSGKFTFIQHPDGYLGFCPTAALKPVSTEDYLAWKNGPSAVALVPIKVPGGVLSAGTRLVWENGHLVLPDGERVKAPRGSVVVSNPARPEFAKALQERAQAFMDSPYLWGGTSAVGIDCSGFVQVLMAQEGIVLPRDASMQCHTGEMVGYLPKMEDLLPGDVLFFMNDKAHVYHVGIFLGGEYFMHSAGATGPIVSSVKKGGKNFMERYDNSICYARRMHR